MDVLTELCIACTRGNHRRIVTYKIFINKQLIYANVTIRLALFIYINIPVHRLSSSCNIFDYVFVLWPAHS